MKFFTLLFISLFALTAAGQSGRTPEPDRLSAEAADPRPVKVLFDEANAYTRTKFQEFEEKKVKFSDELRLQTVREQKQLAAKYAAVAEARTDLSADDIYYRGLLHWIAENYDGTASNLSAYAGRADAAPDRAQTALSIAVIANAKLKQMDAAVDQIAKYDAGEPVKLSEVARMNSEVAKAYISLRELEKAVPHAARSYRASKALLTEPDSRVRALDELLDSGMLLFESNRDLGRVKEADEALIDMRAAAASFASSVFFYYSADKLIMHMLETGRRDEAFKAYDDSLARAAAEFKLKAHADDAIRRLKAREKHYRIIGMPAFDFVGIDNWFAGKPQTMDGLKGKVVLLDFWATWCAPCFEAFPHLAEWHRDFSDKGLVILGMTRYYGRAEGFDVDPPAEIAFLRRFREKHDLPYEIAVADDQQFQLRYGATALPTAVLIDRKGMIRYIEAGSSPSRLEEMRAMMLKLLAED
ncbi:MAG TPA: TlpA disulfide reductase family protein [Pyrinomonadaceae bacterium]|nr:TlpA disulfide reductase family protein [Pyrinomonadaceae bacterium]